MKTCLFALILIFMSAVVVQADFVMPEVDFFMHSRLHDIFIRDHFRFDEPRPLQIEYNYIKWQESKGNYDEYADNLGIETDIPIYKSDRILVSAPFSYSRLPVWSEKEDMRYGVIISSMYPSILSRFVIMDKFKSIVGIEYNLKGNSGADLASFGASKGRMICVPNLVFSYDLLKQLNIMAGGRLERYYYDTEETDFAVELSDRLYLRPIAMLNLHLNDDFAVLLGLPYLGGYVSLANGIIKAEARATLNQNTEIALKIRPISKTHLTFRFQNNPYKEIPFEGFVAETGEFLEGRLEHTNQVISIEAGRELNPAAIASLAFQYSPEADVGFTSDGGKDYLLNGKSSYSFGVRFTVDIEALLQIK